MKVWWFNYNGYHYYINEYGVIINCEFLKKEDIDAFERISEASDIINITDDFISNLDPRYGLPYGQTKYSAGMPDSHRRDCNVYTYLHNDGVYLISETRKVIDPSSDNVFNICGFIYDEGKELGIDISEIELNPKLAIPYSYIELDNSNGPLLYNNNSYYAVPDDAQPVYASRYEAMPHFMTHFNLTSEDMDSLKKLWQLHNMRSDDTVERSKGNHYFLQGILEHCEVEWETWSPKMTPSLFTVIYEDYPQLMVTNKQFKFN